MSANPISRQPITMNVDIKAELVPVKQHTTYTTVPLPPCKVCGGTATGFHFGVITCEACKAFFRRALIQKQNYKCSKDNSCEITDKRLGNCSSCRLKKCFALGMSKEGVRRGRYSIAIRTKAIIEAKKQEGKQAVVMTRNSTESLPSSSPKSSPPSSPPLSFGSLSPESLSPSSSPMTRDSMSSTSGEESMDIQDLDLLSLLPPVTPPVTTTASREIELLADALISSHEVVYPNTRNMFDTETLEEHHRKIYENHHIKQEMFGFMEPLSTEQYQEIFAETGIDLDDRLTLFDKKGRSMEQTIMQYINFAKVIPGFKNINPKDVSKLLKAAHFEFWMFGHYHLMNYELGVCGGAGYTDAHKSDMSKFFPMEFIEKCLAFADTLKALDLTLEEMSILRAVLLTFTDRCSLIESEKVENLQVKFLSCLIHQIQKSSKNPNKKLAAILDRLTVVRELTVENVLVNKQFLQEWGFLMHEYPLWKEMLSYDEV